MKKTPQFDGHAGGSLPHVFLYPGTMHCTPTPSVVTTVLGSCVAVCLIDWRRQLSGINHFMLPHDEDTSSLRHGASAIALLLEEMLRGGARVETIKAKVFGGAAVLPVRNCE